MGVLRHLNTSERAKLSRNMLQVRETWLMAKNLGNKKTKKGVGEGDKERRGTYTRKMRETIVAERIDI